MSPPVDPVTCSDVLDRLETWIDGDLETGEAAAIEAHVEGCTACKAEHRVALEIRSRLQAMPELDPPDRVLNAVRDAAAPAVGERFDLFLNTVARRPVPAVAALAAVIVLVLAVAPWMGKPTPQISEREAARAAAETRLALAYVGVVARRAEQHVRYRILSDGPVSATVRGISRSIKWTGGPAGAEPTTTVLPKKNPEGSS